MTVREKLISLDNLAFVDTLTSMSPITKSILANRPFNISAEFFNPRPSSVDEIFEIPDTRTAVYRILKALDNQETILIHGDYDADGITGSTVLYQSFKKMGIKNVSVYIPNRATDDYGITRERVLDLTKNVDLLISVDCGVNNDEAVAALQEQGVDVIITDHHMPDPDHTSKPLALINPKVINNSLLMLAGVGVAYELMRAVWYIAKQEGREFAYSSSPDELLDIVALGTIADSVPLLGVNRFIAKEGLKKMSVAPCPAIRILLKKYNINQVTSTSVLFKLAPALNSTGRLGSAMLGVSLFMAENEEETERIVDEIIDLNLTRKELTNKICEELLSTVSKEELRTTPCIVLFGHTVHLGIAGIIASRIIEMYNKPTIILGEKREGILSGSCRSVEGYNLLDALSNSAVYLMGFGGHKEAAGLTLKAENFQAFKECIQNYVASKRATIKTEPIVYVDAKVNPQDLTVELEKELEIIGPFGVGNPEPLFLLEQATITGIRPIRVGNIVTIVKNEIPITLLDFNGCYSTDMKGKLTNVVGTFTINRFRGKVTPQLIVQKADTYGD